MWGLFKGIRKPSCKFDRSFGFSKRSNGADQPREKKSGKSYNRDDINFFHTLARQGAVAIENARLFQENIEKSRMEEELKIAHNLQISMLPDKAPTIEGFSIVARSIPAREVGGDFYDFIEITENRAKRLGIVVGDVSGKAVSGALVMAASGAYLGFWRRPTSL